jgi:hypothetical protein
VLLHVLERIELLDQDAIEQSQSNRFCFEAVIKRLEKLEAALLQHDTLLIGGPQDKLDRLIELDSDDDAPTPEAAPVATDNGLVRCYGQAIEDAVKRAASHDEAKEAGRRAIYDLGRRHGAQSQPAPVAPEPGEVEELMRRLRDWHSIPLLQERERIATLLEQQQHLLGLACKELDAFMEQLSAPTPVVVPVAIPGEQWHEDDGFCLWWLFPIEEPPYSGSPLCDDWPGYHTHFTRISIPLPQAGGEAEK